MSIMSNMQYSMDQVTSEWGMYVKFMIEDSWERKTLIKSKMDFCMADIKSEGVNEYP